MLRDTASPEHFLSPWNPRNPAERNNKSVAWSIAQRFAGESLPSANIADTNTLVKKNHRIGGTNHNFLT